MLLTPLRCSSPAVCYYLQHKIPVVWPALFVPRCSSQPIRPALFVPHCFPFAAATYLASSPSSGLHVSHVHPRSHAHQLVHPGDIITAAAEWRVRPDGSLACCSAAERTSATGSPTDVIPGSTQRQSLSRTAEFGQEYGAPCTWGGKHSNALPARDTRDGLRMRLGVTIWRVLYARRAGTRDTCRVT